MENNNQLKYKVGDVLYHEYKKSWRIIKIVNVIKSENYIRFEYKVLHSNNCNNMEVFRTDSIFSFISKPHFDGLGTYYTAIKVDMDNLPKEILAKIL
jgi:hypothetical protein